MSRVKVIQIKKYEDKPEGHYFYLVKDVVTGRNHFTAKSASEAIHFIEEEGYILEPDYTVPRW